MRMIAAALAGAAIFLVGCDGNGAPEEEGRSEATANDAEEENAVSDENESGEEAGEE